MVKKLFVAIAAAGLLSACVPALAQNRILQSANGNEISPVRVAKVKMVNGKAVLAGPWINYSGTSTDAIDTVFFDCDERTEPFDEGTSWPTGAKYGRDCAAEGLPDGSRWFFGTDWINPAVINDMQTSTAGANAQATWTNYCWYWGDGSGGFGDQQCFVLLFTGEDFPTTPQVDIADVTFFDGIAYDFGVIGTDPGGYYFTNVDLTASGLFHQMPADRNGAYLAFLSNETDGTVFFQAPFGQFMLFGTKGTNPSSQGLNQYDDGAAGDGSDLDLIFDRFDYTFGVCPDPLGAAVAFLGEGGGGGPEIVRPNAVVVQQGILIGGGVPELQDDDNLVVNVRQRASASPATPNVGMVVSGRATSGGSPTRLDILVRATSTGSPLASIIFRIEAFNYDTSAWTRLRDAAPSGTGEQLYTFVVTGAAADAHVSAAGDVSVRLRWFDRGATSPGWRGTVDQVQWTITR